MKKQIRYAISTTLLWLVLVQTACQTDFQTKARHSVDSKTLTPSQITLDDNSQQNIKQITITFNTDIAIPGAVPSPAQIASIHTLKSLEQNCHWRFVDTRRMACELQQPLSPASTYPITVAAGFPGLAGQSTTKALSMTIQTPFPSFEIRSDYQAGAFFNRARVVTDYDLSADKSALEQHLKIKTPDGQYLPLPLMVNPGKNQRRRLTITLDTSDIKTAQLVDGQYQVVLTPGLTLTQGDYALAQEKHLYSFGYYRAFRWLGFACLSDKFNPTYQVALNDKQLLACNPDNVALTFSDYIEGSRSQKTFTWLTGADYIHGRPEHNGDGHFIYPVNLTGEQRYRLDLSQVQSRSGDTLDNAEVIEFVTDKASPTWAVQIGQHQVIETDQDTAPVIVSRNIDSLNVQVTPIKNRQDLLKHLNQQPLTQIDTQWPLTQQAPSAITKTNMPVRHLLDHTSGLASVTLFGQDQQKKQWINSAAFNIAYWLNDDLLLYLSDWQQAKPLGGVKVSLLCQGFGKPLTLGQSAPDGTLLINKTRWQSLYRQDKSCWLWADLNGLSATTPIETPMMTSSQEFQAFTWTGQPVYLPGDTIDFAFIARTRSASGLQAITDLSDYELFLNKSYHNENNKKALTLSPLSQFGFATGSFKTAYSIEPDMYSFVLVPKHGPKRWQRSKILGHVAIESFSAPEYEVNIKLFDNQQFEKKPFEKKQSKNNRIIYHGDAVFADISAKRLNGIPLKHASVAVNYRLTPGYSTPKSWPQDYQYSSYKDRLTNAELSENQTGLLDEKGHYHFVGEKVVSPQSLGRITINTMITATDGEVQEHRASMIYLGRNHYIGTRRQTDNENVIELAGIAANGSPLHNLAVSVGFYHQIDDKLVALGECKLTRLPGACPLPKQSKHKPEHRILLQIRSGDENYLTSRDYFWHQPKVRSIADQVFSLTTSKKSTMVGQPIELTLYSPHNGNVRLVAMAGEVKKTWMQTVTKGANTITVIPDPSWQPQARVSAFLPLPRTTPTSPSQKTDLKSLLGHHINTARGWQNSTSFNVTSALPPLKVTTRLPLSTLKSGATVEFTLNSNQDAQSQIWLINEALWQLTGTTESSFDLSDHFMESNWLNGDFLSLSQNLITPESMQKALESPMSLLNKRRESASLSDISPQTQTPGQRFSQSVWLDLVSLNAGQDKKVSIQLPQLLGRWQLVVVSANHQQFALSSHPLITSQPMEYFVDTPSNLLADDKATISLLAINRLSQPQDDELTLWLDNKKWQTVPLTMSAKQQKQLHFDLPPLLAGTHQLHLTSQKQKHFKTQNLIEVHSGLSQQHLSWLYQAGQQPQSVMPAHFLPNSLQLAFSPADNLAPAWQSLTDYNANYAHQCWEQNISRALSYFYAPGAQQQWPQGEAELIERLNQANNFYHYDHLFRFFNQGNGDPFLTAYSYLVQHWLQQKSVTLPINKSKQKERLLKLFDKENQGVLVRSMALLALAANGDIDTAKTLKLRQQIGAGSAYAQALQLWALKIVNANSLLISDATTQLLSMGYQDPSLSLVNNNSQRCFAALAIGESHPRARQLVAEVINSQQQLGHFGSTFANGVCSYLLTQHPAKNQPHQPLSYTLNPQAGGQTITFVPPSAGDHWLKLDYQQAYQQMKATQQGVGIKRRYSVLRQISHGQQQIDSKRNKGSRLWQTVHQGDKLVVGDLIEIELTIDNPVAREHLAITDHLPGAFEAINPDFQHQFSGASNDYQTRLERLPNIQISANKVMLYPRHSQKGQTVYRYFARVRHQGHYLAPGATVEMMYQSNVWGRSEFFGVSVKATD